MSDDKMQLALIKQELKLSQEHTEHKFQELRDIVERGFEGVYDRQDKTNGKVMKNTKWRWLTVGGLAVTNAILIPVAIIVVSKILDRAL